MCDRDSGIGGTGGGGGRYMTIMTEGHVMVCMFVAVCGSAEVCGVVRCQGMHELLVQFCASFFVCFLSFVLLWYCALSSAPVHRCTVIICGVGLAAPSLHFSLFLACAGAALWTLRAPAAPAK